MGEVYEEDYEEEPVIKENDSWYTNQEEVLEEGVAGHRERNDIVVYENGAEVSRVSAPEDHDGSEGSSCGAWNDRAADIH